MEKTASPCISLCRLNDQDICEGCFRTSEEIRMWVYLNDDQRQIIIENCSERANSE
jgi:predicted Fe-S protein YdhL (DUF1289 family)